MGAYVHVSNRTLLSMKGPDSQDLLQRISTNDLSKLQKGGTTQTILTNGKGRIVDVLDVHKRDGNEFLLAGHSKTPKEIVGWLDKFIIMDDVDVRNLMEDFAQFQLFEINDQEISSYLSIANILTLRSKYRNCELTRAVVDASKAADFEKTLQNHGIVHWSDQDYEMFRVDRGMPDWPNEFCDRFNPLELGLEHLVSFSKGCYIGQEVIARLDTYKKVQKRIVRLGLESDPTTLPSDLLLAGRHAGVITSSASRSNSRFGTMAIGFIDMGTETAKGGFYYLRNAMKQSAHVLYDEESGPAQLY